MIVTFFFVSFYIQCFNQGIWVFPGGTVDGNPPAHAGDMGSSLVREDSTCCGATKPLGHNY